MNRQQLITGLLLPERRSKASVYCSGNKQEMLETGGKLKKKKKSPRKNARRAPLIYCFYQERGKWEFISPVADKPR